MSSRLQNLRLTRYRPTISSLPNHQTTDGPVHARQRWRLFFWQRPKLFFHQSTVQVPCKKSTPYFPSRPIHNQGSLPYRVFHRDSECRTIRCKNSGMILLISWQICPSPSFQELHIRVPVCLRPDLAHIESRQSRERPGK